MLTLSDIRTRVLRHIDEYASSSDGENLYELIDHVINDAQVQRLTEINWPFMLWPRPVTFSTTATRYYALHTEFHRPLYVFNQTTKEYLVEVPFRQLQPSQARWNTDTGKADRFTLSGRMPVLAQPSSSSTVSIVSSSGSDTTAAKAITVRGETTNGVTTESLTPNGTSTVTSTNSFTYIIGVTKAAAWVGNMTLSAGATTLLTLLPSEYGRTYQQLEMLRTPDSGDTIEYRFFRKPTVLSADNDIPDIPYPFSELLVWDTLFMLSHYFPDEVTPAALNSWMDSRLRLETAMKQTFLDGQSIGAEPRYVHYVDDYEPGVRINWT